MKILALADQESKYLWDQFNPKKLEEIDLILSCGDLDPNYLSFIATFTKAPVLYVHGNHDDCYQEHPPHGCICIENQVYVHNGVRILGLGGSMRYKKGVNQYTEQEMAWRVKKMWLQLHRTKGFDILLTHSPAFDLGDDKDLPHVGFCAFHTLLNRYKPSYFVHGHTHLNYGLKFKRYRKYGKTKVINAYERCEFEIEPMVARRKKRFFFV